MALPAGVAPATVSFEASRAVLLRYGSEELIRPRATELHSCRPVADGLPFVREMARRCSWIKAATQRAKGLSLKLVASLGFAPRLPASETGVLLLHYEAILTADKIGMARQLGSALGVAVLVALVGPQPGGSAAGFDRVWLLVLASAAATAVAGAWAGGLRASAPPAAA